MRTRRLCRSIDTVYMGEVVCSKRRGLTIDDIKRLADDLTANGKKVYLSTLAIVATEEELSYIRELTELRLCHRGQRYIRRLDRRTEKGLEVAAGPHITTYNAG